MITCSSLSKNFPTPLFHQNAFYALQDISFELKPQSAYALVGPNGSGKTTLLSCILGLYHPSEGAVTLQGLSPQNPQSKHKVGYLPEHFSTFPDITPVQAIEYYFKLTTQQQPDIQLVYSWLDRLELHTHKHRKIGSFSKGMVQRLGIIISLIHDPSLIIWDEPTSGLDPEGRKLVLDLIEEEKQKGKTLIISTHILSDIEKTCDHVLILKSGKLLLDENIVKACEEKKCNLEELYLSTIHEAAS